MPAELRDYPRPKCQSCKTKDASKILVDGRQTFRGSFCAACSKEELKKLQALEAPK